jgi:site-specific DNA recombinase
MSKAIARKKITVHPEEAEVVRLIYQWYLEGQGGKAIAQRLNAEGKLYRGRPWLKDRIFDIIGDESYVGRYYFNKRDHKTHRPKPKEEWVLMQVEPIVDQVTWERAKALKEERDPTKGANPAAVASKTLLTGLAVCGLCGARMTLETSRGGRRFTYYNCSNYIRRGKAVCPGQRIPARELEQAVLDHMANKLFTAERVKAILKGVYEEVRKLEKGNDAQRKSLNRQLDVIKAKLGKQYEAIESGAIELRDVGERIRELKERREQITAKLEEIKSPKPIPLHFFKNDAIVEFQQTIRELFLGETDRDVAKRYLKLFIERITINLPKVDIVGKSEVVLAVLENKKAVRTGGILTALGSWLPGTDSNCRPSGYKCPDISTRLGLSHHPSQFLGLRVSGASPPGFTRRVRAEALVSAPSLNIIYSGLGSGLPFSTTRGGQASLNSPDFSTTISRGSCSLLLQPPALPTELPGNFHDMVSQKNVIV